MLCLLFTQIYESKWLSGEQNHPEITVFRQQNYLKQQVNFLNYLTQISYMKMMFLCFILFQTQKLGIEVSNRDIVYDLAHRCRWFVTGFRLHFPFRSVSNVSNVTTDKSCLEKHKLFIKMLVCFGYNTFSPYWYQHAMKQDVSILMPSICISLNTCFLHGLFED